MTSALIAGCGQILSRFIFISPSVWTESWIRFSIIWLVFCALPLAFEDGKMLRLNFLKSLVSQNASKSISIISMTISLCFLVALTILGVMMFFRSQEQMLAGLDISISWAYLAIPVGSSLSALALIDNLLKSRFKEM
ncbi:TRAP transporter small permease [Taylorella equigenitalis]|uniref:TRAP transporter small permease n=1 Tax=Taylorella equigenitalis TaxID=29575 RepID=UPI001ED98AA7|nr:TRAP transporter small permease [Taylorella equigenitalis]